MDNFNQQELFTVNVLILVDAFVEKFPMLHYRIADDDTSIRGLGFYESETALRAEYCYFCNNIPSSEELKSASHSLFVFVGFSDFTLTEKDVSYIVLPEQVSMAQAFNVGFAAWQRYYNWTQQLQIALAENKHIDVLCEIAFEYFRNPLNIHDSEFYIVSCPHYFEGMTLRERDENTNREHLSTVLINYFKGSDEYKHTMVQKKAMLFSGNIHEYRTMYYNLWNGDAYLGRICIHEFCYPLHPGDFKALEYFGGIILLAIQHQNITPGSFSRGFEIVLTDILDGNAVDMEYLYREINVLGWKPEDAFALIVFDPGTTMLDLLSAKTASHYLESKVEGAYAIFYRDHIVMLLDLALYGQSLSVLVENLYSFCTKSGYRIGISNSFCGLQKTNLYYEQCMVALSEKSLVKENTWARFFSDVALSLLLTEIKKAHPIEIYCADTILKLMEYDKKNDTELAKTLWIYLQLERNAVRTAKALIIHRSTLLYRLERITQITGVNLDADSVRLHLLLSYALLGKENGFS